MAGQNSITVKQETFDHLRESKPDSVTWDSYLLGLADGGTGDSAATVTLSPGSVDDLGTDIAQKVARRVTDELRR